jgi:hypothetical protein
MNSNSNDRGPPKGIVFIVAGPAEKQVLGLKAKNKDKGNLILNSSEI